MEIQYNSRQETEISGTLNCLFELDYWVYGKGTDNHINQLYI